MDNVIDDIIWEKKNANDPDQLTFDLLVEYSHRLYLQNPNLEWKEFVDKYNKNFFPKIDRPSYYNDNYSECNLADDMAFLLYEEGYINYSCYRDRYTEIEHDRLYKILLEKGINLRL